VKVVSSWGKSAPIMLMFGSFLHSRALSFVVVKIDRFSNNWSYKNMRCTILHMPMVLGQSESTKAGKRRD
jgi:hypothetical protein